MRHERAASAITGCRSLRAMGTAVLATTCLLIAACAAPPPESAPAPAEPTTEDQTSAGGSDSKPSADSGSQPDDEAAQPKPAHSLHRLLAYYRRSGGMSESERRGEAARLRARMATSECTPQRLKVLMLAIRQPELVSEPEALMAPCVAHESPDRPQLAGLAHVLADRFAGVVERQQLAERNADLMSEVNGLQQRNRRLREQLNKLKEIEQSIE